jgi:hypothetical protein
MWSVREQKNNSNDGKGDDYVEQDTANQHTRGRDCNGDYTGAGFEFG